MVKKFVKYITIAFISLSALTFLSIWQLEKMSIHDSALVTLMLFGAGEPLNLNVHQISWFTGVIMVGQTIMGLAALSLSFGLLAEFVMSEKLAKIMMKEKIKMNDHVILCGLGNVGFSVIEELERMQQTVVVIDRGDEKDFIELVKKRGHKVLVGNLKDETILDDANIAQAKSVIICTGNDLLNMEVALNARGRRQDIIIVMRMFDQKLAEKVSHAFNIKVVFSSSALAAPVFAAASIDRTVFRSVRIEERLFVSARVEVETGSKLDGSELKDFCDKDLAVLKLISEGERLIFPNKERRLKAGDVLYFTCTPETLQEVKELNIGA